MPTRVTAFRGPLRLTRSSLFFTLQPEPPAATSPLTGVPIHPDPHRVNQAEWPWVYSLLFKCRAKRMNFSTKEVMLVLAFIAGALFVSLMIGEKFVAVVLLCSLVASFS